MIPELDVKIGGRPYQVPCQDGEEAFLLAAARLLDAEAEALIAQTGRLPEGRMLLLAGLMLADKLSEAQKRLTKAQTALRQAEMAEPQRVEVPVIPASLGDAMAELAARAEALAALAEEKTAQ